MNEQNKKLYLESLDTSGNFCYQRFAELVRQDERRVYVRSFMELQHAAIEETRLEEREACARLCDDWFAATAGRAIRERGKPPDPSFKNFINDKWSGIV